MPFTPPDLSFSPLKTVIKVPRKSIQLPRTMPANEAAFAAMMAGIESDLEAATAAMLASVQSQVKALHQEAHDYIIHQLEQAALSRRRLYGSSSEQMSAQGLLFDEAEVLAQGTSAEQDVAPLPPEAPQAPLASGDAAQAPKAPARGKRSPLPAGLPRIDVLHEVPEADRLCACGTPMVVIGQEVSEQLDIVPMQVRVLRHIRKRYGCPNKDQGLDQNQDASHAPILAALPPQPLPKTNASPHFLAMLLANKFVDGLPLARIEQMLARHHATVPRQTLARWVIGSAKVLQPLHNLMRDSLLDSAYLHMDETVVQVLKEPGKAATSNSYMWVQTGGPPDKPIILYDYDSSRSGKVPTRLLEGFKGYLMTDGYDGYNEVARTSGVERMACWAHVRRRFVEACIVNGKGKRGRADEAVSLIGKLYRIEKDLKDASIEERHAARQIQSGPILEDLHAWMIKTTPQVTPKSALGTALAYMQKLWPELTRYTERGDLPIDNNRCENAIRPFVMGRKAWLFSDTVAGANASAVIYSLVQTARANKLEPYLWLCQVMRKLPAAKTLEDVEALLPWNISLADLLAES
jgi:transposase